MVGKCILSRRKSMVDILLDWKLEMLLRTSGEALEPKIFLMEGNRSRSAGSFFPGVTGGVTGGADADDSAARGLEGGGAVEVAAGASGSGSVGSSGVPVTTLLKPPMYESFRGGSDPLCSKASSRSSALSSFLNRESSPRLGSLNGTVSPSIFVKPILFRLRI